MAIRTEAFPDIDAAMKQAVADSVFPGAVLLWGIRDRVMFHGAYGRTDKAGSEQVDTDTIFDLASLTKPLGTALAMADLVSRRQVELSTCLGEILPVPRHSEKGGITIDMLLRHTSGLPAHREYFRQVRASGEDPRDNLRTRILAEPLEARPGKKEIYSDLGYILLAWVVEAVSGQGLDAFVRERILAPLGIEDLFFIPVGETGPLHPERLSGRSVASTSFCPWRDRMIKGEVEDENAWAAGGVEGHAGLFGTALAVYRLCSEILAAVTRNRPRVLDVDVIRAFTEKRGGMGRVAGFDTPSRNGSSAGRYFSPCALGHLGFTGTSFWMAPETGLITVLLTNRVHPSRNNWEIKHFRPVIHELISLKIMEINGCETLLFL